MKSRKTRKWQWVDPLYNVGYFLYTGEYEGFAAWINSLGDDPEFLDPDYNAVGQTVWFHTLTPLRSAVGFYIGSQTNMKNPEHLNTVTHEALHGVFAVMGSRGLILDENSDEAFTYYLGWIVEEMTKRLMK